MPQKKTQLNYSTWCGIWNTIKKNACVASHSHFTFVCGRHWFREYFSIKFDKFPRITKIRLHIENIRCQSFSFHLSDTMTNHDGLTTTTKKDTSSTKNHNKKNVRNEKPKIATIELANKACIYSDTTTERPRIIIPHSHCGWRSTQIKKVKLNVEYACGKNWQKNSR